MKSYKTDMISSRSLLLAAGLMAGLGFGVTAFAADAAPASATHSSSMGTAMSDTDITAKVKYKFSSAKSLEGSDITVTTNDGVVMLTGTATGSKAQRSAESLAKSVDGVKSVDDELTTPTSNTKGANARHGTSDAWITTKVKSELMADSVSKGIDVKVVTTRGVVVLTGKLASQNAIDHVKHVTEAVDGVKSVDTTDLTIGS